MFGTRKYKTSSLDAKTNMNNKFWIKYAVQASTTRFISDSRASLTCGIQFLVRLLC